MIITREERIIFVDASKPQSISLPDAISGCRSGDIIHLMPGRYEVTPRPALNDNASDSAMALLSKSNVSINGIGSPVIFTKIHGNPLVIWNCANILVNGITFEGPGQLREPNSFYYALLLLHGVNHRIRVNSCIFRDSGNHGIAHLSGPRTSNNCTFEGNVFERGGNFNRLGGLGGDGAAIAVGGSGNLFLNNQINDWMGGIEIEGHDKPNDGSSVIIRNNRIENVARWSIFVTTTSGDSSTYNRQIIEGNILIGPAKATPGFLASGIYYTGGSPLITGNDISGHQGIGISVITDWADIWDALVASNKVSNVGSSGIHLGPAATGKRPISCQIHGNKVSSCGGRGVYIDADYTQAIGNQIQGCAYVGMHIVGGKSNQIAYNYLRANKPRVDDTGPVPHQFHSDVEIAGMETNFMVE